MNKEDFYELIDIETPEDFKFYDNIENLVEADEPWDAAILLPVIREVEEDTLEEIVKEYFQGLQDRLPEEHTELYTLIYNAGRAMRGLSSGGDSSREDSLRRLAHELERFSRWFSKDSKVEMKDMDSGEIQILPLRDALGHISLEKLGMGNYTFDFEDALDYEVDEYVMNLMEFNGAYGDSQEEADEN